jgi:Protein of unknown function (DUF3106)
MFECKPYALALILAAALGVLVYGHSLAQTSTPVMPTSPAKTTGASTKVTPQPAKPIEVASGPSWADLTIAQKAALAPLASSWVGINEAQKRKWLEISKNYPRLSPLEQTTMHSRMNEWVTMSPQERAQARLNFAKTKELSTELTTDEKKAKWETYQALSSEEKQGLAAAAVPKPAGAATAVKPVAPQKLVLAPKSPASKASAPAASVAAAAPPALPLPATSPAPAPATAKP